MGRENDGRWREKDGREAVSDRWGGWERTDAGCVGGKRKDLPPVVAANRFSPARAGDGCRNPLPGNGGGGPLAPQRGRVVASAAL